MGQLGLPVAKYIKDRGGFDTSGYDISTKAMDRAQKMTGIKRIGDNSNNVIIISIIAPEIMVVVLVLVVSSAR